MDADSMTYYDYLNLINSLSEDEFRKFDIKDQIKIYDYVLRYAGFLQCNKPKNYRNTKWLGDLIHMWNENMVSCKKDDEPNLK